MIFEKRGFDCWTSDSGAEAVAFADEFCPELLLCDMSGLEVVSKIIRKCPDRRVLLPARHYTNLGSAQKWTLSHSTPSRVMTKPVPPACCWKRLWLCFSLHNRKNAMQADAAPAYTVLDAGTGTLADLRWSFHRHPGGLRVAGRETWRAVRPLARGLCVERQTIFRLLSPGHIPVAQRNPLIVAVRAWPAATLRYGSPLLLRRRRYAMQSAGGARLIVAIHGFGVAFTADRNPAGAPFENSPMSPSFKSPWEKSPGSSRQPATSGSSRPQMDLLFPASASAAQAGDFVRPPWKVHELVFEIRGHVEKEYRDLRVEGEISNLRQASSGHVYFTLKDDRSQLPVVLFRGKARLLKFTPKDGLEVQVRGGISVYEDRGQLQLVAESMEPRGKGSLQVAFEQLYALLKEEGLFQSERKRSLPMYPRTIGVITSQKGAVIHDILNVLARRHSRAHVLLYPVAVQGEAAASDIVNALAWFQKNPCVDVLVVARGGGSPEDLAAFNNEGVARAISGSAIPVVSAVGHETDFTIADFVADLRAPTPSIAAEIITDAQYRVEEYLELLAARLERSVRYQRMRARERFAQLNASAVFAGVQHGLARRQQRVDELRFRLESSCEKISAAAGQRIAVAQANLMRQDVRRQMTLHGERLRALQIGLGRAWNAYSERCRTRCSRGADRLWALSPLAVLDRGYALVYDGSGSLIKTSESLHPDDALRLRFAHGQAHATVVSLETAKKKNDN